VHWQCILAVCCACAAAVGAGYIVPSPAHGRNACVQPISSSSCSHPAYSLHACKRMARMRARTHTCTQVHKRRQVHACTHAHAHTHVHARTHARTACRPRTAAPEQQRAQATAYAPAGPQPASSCRSPRRARRCCCGLAAGGWAAARARGSCWERPKRTHAQLRRSAMSCPCQGRPPRTPAPPGGRRCAAPSLRGGEP